MVYESTININTNGNTDIIDITSHTNKIIKKSGIEKGIIVVSTPGSTGSVTTVEYEPGLVKHDIREALEVFAPSNKHYQHNLTWGDNNGDAHVRATILGPSISLPVSDNKAVLGTWQQIIFIDFDERPRHRTLAVVIIGE